MGGLPAGPIERDEHGLEPWEKRVDAIVTLLGDARRRLISPDFDDMRRAIEGLGPGAYDRLGYYERWIAAAATLLIEKGVLTGEELGQRMAEIERARGRAG